MQIIFFLSNFIHSIPDYFIFFLSPVVWLFISVLFLCIKRKSPYRYFASLLHILFAVVFLLRFPVKEAVVCFLFSCFFYLCFRPIAKHRFKKRIKKPKVDPVKAIADEILNQEIPLLPAEEKKPQKVVMGDNDMSEGEEVYSLERENISLNHVIGVALSIKKANFSIGDRLETENIFRTLSLYRAKNGLTKEEVASLNGYLSTLLKLMSKYSL